MTHITLPRAVVEQALLGLENYAVRDTRYLPTITTLRAALEAKEVEPVAWMHGDDSTYWFTEKQNDDEYAIPLYTTPAGWLRAVDEALVTAHIGVADAGGSYKDAKKKLDALIDWSIQVAIDLVVNGGFVLVPKEPTPEMYAAWDNSTLSGFDERYKAMLSAAPEVKK